MSLIDALAPLLAVNLIAGCQHHLDASEPHIWLPTGRHVDILGEASITREEWKLSSNEYGECFTLAFEESEIPESLPIRGAVKVTGEIYTMESEVDHAASFYTHDGITLSNAYCLPETMEFLLVRDIERVVRK